jgi:predicted nicotinamide N-methyase
VCRLQFRRALPSIVKAGVLLSTEIVSCSEFNEPVACAIHSPVDLLEITLTKHENNNEITVPLVLPLLTKATDSGTRVGWVTPSECGEYSLMVQRKSNSSACSCTILPFKTAPFKVVSERNRSNDTVGQYIPPLLWNYRPLRCGVSTVLLKEEYGTTIGSHIYDSSVVLMKYIEQSPDTIASIFGSRVAGCHNVLELGSGCGVAGIWLSSYQSQSMLSQRISGNETNADEVLQPGQNGVCSVYLTDMKSQLPLLSHNVTLNQPQVNSTVVQMHCSELDWGSEEHIATFSETLKGAPLRLIIAGDVFYDRAAAKMFVNVVRRLSTPGVTKILVAQKLRKNSENAAVALIDEEQLRRDFGYDSIELVREEADVRVWLMTAS